jgi:hypothetical protein
MKKYVVAVLLVLVMSTPALARIEIDLPAGFLQDEFRNLSRDVGLAISYMPLAPAEPLGGKLPGFDAGVEVTAVQIDANKLYWQLVEAEAGVDIPNIIPFPKAHVQVGLPIIPIDLGLVFSRVPNSDIRYTGGEVKLAILKGGVVMPALAVRGAMTKLSGVDALDLETKSLDLSISKGFLMLTPYAGFGRVWIDSTPKDPDVSAVLQKERFTENKAFIGLKFSFLPIMNLVAEADFASVNAYSLRFNLHF